MSVKYLCKECKKDNKPGAICEFCFWVVEKIIEKKEVRENPMNKEKAIKFLKSQRYKNWFNNKPIYQRYTDLMDLINKAIPDDKQDRLF